MKIVVFDIHIMRRNEMMAGAALRWEEAKQRQSAKLCFFGVESMRVSFSLPKLIKSNDMYKSLKEKKKRSNFNEKKS